MGVNPSYFHAIRIFMKDRHEKSLKLKMMIP